MKSWFTPLALIVSLVVLKPLVGVDLPIVLTKVG